MAPVSLQLLLLAGLQATFTLCILRVDGVEKDLIVVSPGDSKDPHSAEAGLPASRPVEVGSYLFSGLRPPVVGYDICVDGEGYVTADFTDVYSGDVDATAILRVTYMCQALD